MNMDCIDVVLGCEQLNGLGGSLKKRYEYNSLTFPIYGMHVLLFGDKNFPLSSLICNAKLSQLSHDDGTKDLFLCYSLCQFLPRNLMQGAIMDMCCNQSYNNLNKDIQETSSNQHDSLSLSSTVIDNVKFLQQFHINLKICHKQLVRYI